MKTRKKIALAIFIPVFLGGIGLYSFPYVNGYLLELINQKQYQSFLLLQEELEESEEPIILYPELLEASKKYNANLVKTEQKKLRGKDVVYEDPAFILADYGVPDEVFALIEIPALEVEMPIYLGSNLDNLNNGATHMTETSLPIGGKNTNCVIAAHRGWKGAAYFKYIPRLKVGDEVYITNLWEKLTYKVIDKRNIYNSESEYLFIQKDKDLVTLLTCNYGEGGTKHRYLVICERVTEDEAK